MRHVCTSYMQQPHHLIRLNDCVPEPHQRRVALGQETGLGLKDGVLLRMVISGWAKMKWWHIGVIQPPRAEAARTAQHSGFHAIFNARSRQNLPIKSHLKACSPTRFSKPVSIFYPEHAVTHSPLIGDKISAGDIPELLDLLAWYLGLFIGTVQLTLCRQAVLDHGGVRD